MAIKKLQATQIASIINEVYKNYTGTNEDISVVDAYNNVFGDVGTNDIDALRDNWTGRLLVAISKRWFTDTEYRSDFNSLYFVDSDLYGGITEMYTIVAPEVGVNHAYEVKDGDTVGTYTVNVPKVYSKYYSNINAFGMNFTLTGERIRTAFSSASNLEEFVANMWVAINNKIIAHLEELNETNRNQFIAQKIYIESQKGASVNPTSGVHVVDLVNDYYTEQGATESKTATDFLNDTKALLWTIKKLGFYKGSMHKQTDKFNYDTFEKKRFVRFTPADRFVFELLGTVEDALESNALSNTFHTNFVELPNYNRVECWQGLGDLSFNDLSTINTITVDNHAINTSGIIGLMVDKYAIIHTIKGDRLGMHRLDIEDINIYERQFIDQFGINTTLNGIVFKLGTYTPA